VAACLGFPAGVASNGITVFQPQILVLGATVAILSAVIPYSLEMTALMRIPAGTAGILLSLEPGVAALAGLLVLGPVELIATRVCHESFASRCSPSRSHRPSPSERRLRKVLLTGHSPACRVGR
jgi:hypothetical protein